MQTRVELTDDQIRNLPIIPVELIPTPPDGSYITNPHVIERDGSFIVIEYDLTSSVTP